MSYESARAVIAGEQEGDDEMTAVLSLTATGVLIALGVWVLGGLMLRIGGVLLMAGGLLSTAATGSPSSALLALASIRQ